MDQCDLDCNIFFIPNIVYYPRTILNNYNAAVSEENIFKHFP